ncbi:unnamed protein product [Cochlearia groenlandica]
MEEVTRSVLVDEILNRLDLENLCSVACVSTTLRSAVVSGVLPSLTSLDLSVFSPEEETLNHVLRRCIGLSSLTMNCLRLGAYSVRGVLGPHLRELHLLRCSLLNSTVLASIGSLCPNLRVLTVEMADMDSPVVFQSNLTKMLNGCPYLESLQLNIRGILVDATAFQSVRFSLPETLKALRLQPLLESEAILLMNRFKVTGTYLSNADYSALLSPSPSFTLQSLSLVLDLISDRLIIAITGSLPGLVKLDLEDRPEKEPFPDSDLTYTGLQALGYCQQLTSLSLVRTCYNRKITFKRINDMGIFLLSEACKGLESVRLGGFPKVSDAGFASLLHSCRNLKRFEVRGAFLLSDLAFHDVTGSSCSLQEVRLSTCPLITSEAVKKLGSCSNLELLDLGSCKSISDSCLNTVSALRNLTSLNLAGAADITDNGMLVLGKSDVPITQLSLRGCKRVSDRGIVYLLNNKGTISRTLSTLDLGHMPAISDRAVHAITGYCKALTELSIRSCFHVTDSSIESLATRERQAEGGIKQLRKLNVHNCVRLTNGALRWLSKPSFAGLHWLGLGQTRLANRKDTVAICRERPWLTLCFDGCELGCYDGWEFHTPQRH